MQGEGRPSVGASRPLLARLVITIQQTLAILIEGFQEQRRGEGPSVGRRHQPATSTPVLAGCTPTALDPGTLRVHFP